VAKKKGDDLFVTEKNVKIRLLSVDPMWIARAQASVNMPEVPTYEAQTASGRYEILPLDEEIAEGDPEFSRRWNNYLQIKSAREEKLSLDMMRTMFFFGTELVGELPKNWENKWRFLNRTVPVEHQEKWVFFLENELSAEDMARLMAAIMAKVPGVSEDAIANAEATFLGSVRGSDAGEDEGGDSEVASAA
jgi:hypothetical protein